MITYNDIYESLRKERYSEQIQLLPKDFLKEVAEYIKEKKEISEKKEDLFSEAIVKTRKQLENALSIFAELLLRRKKKLLNLAFVARETGISKRDFENMLEFEKELFDRIVRGMEDCDKKINELMAGGKSESVSNRNCMITFKENVEEFMGLEGNMLGPFEKGELANLPSEIVKILVSAGKAEEIEEC